VRLWFNGFCVGAFSMMVDDENASLQLRNYAIWSLGQIGDPRGRGVILKYYIGTIPEREPYGETLSQYEMKKALKLLDGGTNLTHLVWSL